MTEMEKAFKSLYDAFACYSRPQTLRSALAAQNQKRLRILLSGLYVSFALKTSPITLSVQ